MQQSIKPIVRFNNKADNEPSIKPQQIHHLHPQNNVRNNEQAQYTLPKLNSQISFGKQIRNSPEKDRIKLTFNSQADGQVVHLPPPQYASTFTHYYSTSKPEENNRMRPYSIQAPGQSDSKHLKMKSQKDSTFLKSGQVKTFSIDTQQFKTVKEGQFIGCFTCFEPVTYSTSRNNC